MTDAIRRLFAACKAVLTSEPAEDFAAVFVVVLLACGYVYGAYQGLASGSWVGYGLGFALPTATILGAIWAGWNHI